MLTLLAFAFNAKAAILLSDDFIATGTPDTNDINYNLLGRQTGTLATESWNKVGNVQVGNATDVGQPGGTGGNYLLSAFGGIAGLSTALNSTTVTAPLLISFDMFNGALPTTYSWTSFTLTNAQLPANPIVSNSNEFGFQKFGDGNYSANTVSTGATTSAPATGDSFSVLLTDTAGTGSAFSGNGTVLILKNGGTTLQTFSLAQMTETYISFNTRGEQVGGIDNLVIQTVPEPSTWLMILGGVGVLTMFRRRCA
jgi:hypothetical protein